MKSDWCPSKVNWKHFWDNSSTTDAVYDFAEGSSFKEAFGHIKWPSEVVKELKVLRRLPVKVARQRAQAVLYTQGSNPRPFK